MRECKCNDAIDKRLGSASSHNAQHKAETTKKIFFLIVEFSGVDLIQNYF